MPFERCYLLYIQHNWCYQTADYDSLTFAIEIRSQSYKKTFPVVQCTSLPPNAVELPLTCAH
jgi:hypothetical protein